MNAEQVQMGVITVRLAAHTLRRDVGGLAQAFLDWRELEGIKKTQDTRALVLKSLAERLLTATGQTKVELIERQGVIAANWITDDARARVINARVQGRIAEREGREN